MEKNRVFILLSILCLTSHAGSKSIFQYPERIWSPQIRMLDSKFDKNPLLAPSPLLKYSASQADTFPFAANSTWERLFNVLGPDGIVQAIHAENDTVVVVGQFLSADRENARGVALWNGSKWNGIGSGVLGLVTAVHRVGTEIFVSSDQRFNAFYNGVTAQVPSTKWNGKEWKPLDRLSQGYLEFLTWRNKPYFVSNKHYLYERDADTARQIPGVTGFINGYCALQDGVYLGGNLRLDNDTTQYKMVVWNGQKWSPVLSDFPEDILSLDAFGEEIFITCNTVLRNPVRYMVWRYDRKNPPQVVATADKNEILFTASDSSGLQMLRFNAREGYSNGSPLHLSRWNGQEFALTHSETGFLGFITSFATDNGNAYIGGLFNEIAKQPAVNMAKWNGSAWGAMSSHPESGPPPDVKVLKSDGANLYFGISRPGFFGETKANGIASWNGTNWSFLNGGLSPYPPSDSNGTGPIVYDIALSGADVYVAGRFMSGGGKELNNVARWDGSNWHALGKGIGGWIEKVFVDGANVFVKGYIDTLETETGLVFNSVLAQWNGRNWMSISSDTNLITAMAVFRGVLVVSRQTSDRSYHHVQKWENGAWSDFPDFEILLKQFRLCQINSLNVFQDKLYFIGSIERLVGSDKVEAIAISWDGKTYKRFPAGQIMVGLASGKDHLYGLDSVSHNIWRYDGSGFEEIAGAQVFETPSAVELHQGYFYTASKGLLQDGTSMLPLARWKTGELLRASDWKPIQPSRMKIMGAFHARNQDLDVMLTRLGLDEVDAFSPLGRKVFSYTKGGFTHKEGSDAGAGGYLIFQGKGK